MRKKCRCEPVPDTDLQTDFQYGEFWCIGTAISVAFLLRLAIFHVGRHCVWRVQNCQNLCGMAAHAQLPPDFDKLRIAPNQKTAAHNAHKFAPIKLLFLPHAIGAASFMRLIAGERKGQILCGVKAGLFGGRIRTHTENGAIARLELREQRCQFLRLFGAARGGGAREKIEQKIMPAVCAQSRFAGWRARQTKIRGSIAYAQHEKPICSMRKCLAIFDAKNEFAPSLAWGRKIASRGA